ncbi:helix-turn-helix domain-containing protein [Cetobacterium sp.]
MKFNIIKLKSYFIIEEGIKILKVEIKYLYLAKDNDQEAIEKIIKTYQILIYKNVKQFF